METIKLGYPIEWHKEEIKELKLQRPKGKHFKKFPVEPKMGDFLALGVELAGHPPSLADELDGQDVMKVVEVVGNFLGGNSQTGNIA